jgi:hypothetical protein
VVSNRDRPVRLPGPARERECVLIEDERCVRLLALKPLVSGPVSDRGLLRSYPGASSEPGAPPSAALWALLESHRREPTGHALGSQSAEALPLRALIQKAVPYESDQVAAAAISKSP